MEQDTLPSGIEIQAELRSLTLEVEKLKVLLKNETKRSEREIIENSVLDSIIDKLIEALK